METRDSDDNSVRLSSRLKLSFRSYHSKQPFPPSIRKQYLPSELQELVLAHLPSLKLAELKAVSRSWKHFLQTPRFKEKWQLVRGGRSTEFLDVWVMKCTNGQEDLMAYIPAMKKYSLFLPLLCNPLVTTPYVSLEQKKKFLHGNGLFLVLAEKDWQSMTYFTVYDIYGRHCIHLPLLQLRTEDEDDEYFSSILRPPVLIAAMDFGQFCLVVETQRIYKDGSQPSYELCVFKSRAGPRWLFCSQDSAVDADSLHISHILSGDFFHYNEHDSTLYTFGEEHWYKVSVVNLRDPNSREAKASKVFKCEGQVLLVSPTSQLVGGIVVQGFVLWKLVKQLGLWNWVEISRTPQELCLKSYNVQSLLDPTIMGDGRCICALSSSHEFFPPLVYDVKDDSWYHLDGVLKNMQALFTMKLILDIGKL